MQQVAVKPTQPLNAGSPTSALWGEQSAFARSTTEPIIGVAQFTTTSAPRASSSPASSVSPPRTWLHPLAFRAGNLRFVTSDKKDLGAVSGVRRPSAVLIVRNNRLFEEGVVLVTDKHTHGVSSLTPDEQLRRWLLGETALAIQPEAA